MNEYEKENVSALIDAVLEASHRLSTLSMATTGETRAQIAMANNYLLRAIGRQSRHSIADNMKDDKYREDFSE